MEGRTAFEIGLTGGRVVRHYRRVDVHDDFPPRRVTSPPADVVRRLRELRHRGAPSGGTALPGERDLVLVTIVPRASVALSSCSRGGRPLTSGISLGDRFDRCDERCPLVGIQAHPYVEHSV